MAPLVGFLLPSECWQGGFSYGACCGSREGPCWANFPGGYEACCLFKKLPGEELPLQLGAVRFGANASRVVLEPFMAEAYRRTGQPWSLNEHVFQALSSSWLAQAQMHSCLRSCEAAQSALDVTQEAALLMLEQAGRHLISSARLAPTPRVAPRRWAWREACDMASVPGLRLEEVLRSHRAFVETLVAESLSFQSSDDLIEVDVNRFLLSSKRLANENVALASQLSFLCHAPHYVKEIKLPVSFDRSCCRFWHLVEAACEQSFLSRAPAPVQVVEVGVRLGWLSHYLLSSYDWIHLVGVDLLLPDYGLSPATAEELRARLAFGARVRLLVPMDSVTAGRQLALERLQIDVLVLDARFSEEGFLEDLRHYLPLMRPGGQVLARWGLSIMLRLHEEGGYAGRTLHSLRIGSVWDGHSYAIVVG